MKEGETMKDVLLDTFKDSLELLPFLFLTFLLIELFEHKFSNKSKSIVEKSGKFGPILGSLLGAVPQCGFSVAATNLYITRIISLGTLFSVYLATSDEMLPLLIAEKAPVSLIAKVLLIKVILGMIYGFIIDLLLSKKEKPKYDICDHDHCDCENKILMASIKHTLNIFVFIVICTLLINIILHFFGSKYLSTLLLKNTILGSFLTSLIGLIPNCASSVLITELYLKGAITFASLVGGLLTSAGIATLVLLKENKDKKESLQIIAVLYLIGAITGMILEFFNL